MARPWKDAADIKFLVVYPLPWDIQTSAVYQNGPGIPILREPRREQRRDRAVARPEPGGVRRGRAVQRDRIDSADSEPGDVRGPAPAGGPAVLADVPARGLAASAPTSDIYNVLQRRHVLATNTTYGAAWRDVTQILNGRLLRIGAQWDF